MMNPKAAFLCIYMKSGLKVKRRQKKGGKSREKNFKKIFVSALLLGRKLSQAKNDLF